TTSGGQTITSNTVSISVRNVQPHELVYYGTSATNNPASIDISTINSIDALVGAVDISTGTVTAGDYFIILVPDDLTVNSIIDDILQHDVLSIFTETSSVRVINSVVYNSYVVGPLNADTDGESYTVNLGA
nr:hypothetical protein [Gammaproteobacteria bacterium]